MLPWHHVRPVSDAASYHLDILYRRLPQLSIALTLTCVYCYKAWTYRLASTMQISTEGPQCFNNSLVKTNKFTRRAKTSQVLQTPLCSCCFQGLQPQLRVLQVSDLAYCRQCKHALAHVLVLEVKDVVIYGQQFEACELYCKHIVALSRGPDPAAHSSTSSDA